jgi:hypothetical protein
VVGDEQERAAPAHPRAHGRDLLVGEGRGVRQRPIVAGVALVQGVRDDEHPRALERLFGEGRRRSLDAVAVAPEQFGEGLVAARRRVEVVVRLVDEDDGAAALLVGGRGDGRLEVRVGDLLRERGGAEERERRGRL